MTVPIVLSKRGGKAPTGSVYVGRPSRWGNPFACANFKGTELVEPEEVFPRYVEYLLGIEDLGEYLKPLRGKLLVCWCAPEACHANVLLWLANAPEGRDPKELLGDLAAVLAELPDDEDAQCEVILGLRLPWKEVL